MFISLSGIAMGLGWIFLYEAYAQIGVGLSSLLYYCGPVIVMLLSPVLFHERLTFTKIVGFIMVIAGVFFVNNFAPERAMNRFGLICGGVSALMYSVMVILNKQSKNISGFENAMVQLTASFLTVAVFTGLKSGFIIYIEAEEWLWIIMLGALNTGIGCLLYFSAISKLHVQTVAICGYIEPLSAVLLSFVLLKEAMFPLQVLGAGFILVGALISEISLKKWANKGI